MCCTGDIGLTLALGEARVCCRLRLIALLLLFAVAVALVGHFAIDAAVPSTSALAGSHLHSGFPLPAMVTIRTAPVWAFPVPVHSIDLDSWIEPPTTPPPLGLFCS